MMQAMDRHRPDLGSQALLSVRDLRKRYAAGRKARAQVLDGVDFDLQVNETVGLVGASGAGKSTIGRILVNLEKADSGTILYRGNDLRKLRGNQRRAAMSSISMVFQDPYEYLSPRMRIEQIVAEPLMIRQEHRDAKAAQDKVWQALADVGLNPDKYARRYAHELSGGERQRVGLARAFVTHPLLLIADEPTSMLDASLRLDLLDCMAELKAKHQTATLFITHDLALTSRFCDRLIVLNEGKIVEEGAPAQIIGRPQHHFTKKLMESLRTFHD